jgi:hypothetical protein
MTRYNLKVPQFQILIGSDDISDAVVGFSFHHPLAEPSTPLIWTGTIEMFPVRSGHPRSFFDDRLHPDRWLSGQQPIDVYFNATWWQRFRIKPNGYRFNPDNGQAEIEITDIIGLLESYTPAADAPEFKTGFDNHWNTLVVELINKQASLMGRSVSVTTPAYGIGGIYKVPRTIQGSYLQEAQRMLGERGQWMWSDKEVIKFATYPLYGGAPIWRKSRQELLNYKRQQGLEPVVAQITVSATHETVDVCRDVYPKTITEYASGLVITSSSGLLLAGKRFDRVSAFTKINKTVTNSTTTLTTTRQGIPAVDLFGGIVNQFGRIEVTIPKIKGYKERKLGGSDYWIEYEDATGRRTSRNWASFALLLAETDITTYEDIPITSQNPSKILSRVITRKEPLIKRNINIFENYKGSDNTSGAYSLSYALPLIFDTERITTRYTYTEIFRDDIIVQVGQKLYEVARIEEIKEQIYFEKRANRFGFNGEPTGYVFTRRFIPVEKTITTYKKECQGRWEERKSVSLNKGQSKTSSGYLYQTQNTVQDVYSIPEITYRPLPFPVVQKPLLATVSTGYAGISPFVQNRDFKSASTLTTKGELENYARIMGIMRWQRYYSYEIAAGYQTVLNYAPFQIVDAGDGRFIRDRFGVSLNYENESWQFVEDCIGNLVGGITAIAPPRVPFPPLLISSLNIGAIPTQNFIQGVAINSVTFNASGGVLPYTFSATLPSGLSLSSGGVLSGTPLAIATTSVTVTVTDAIASSANTTFNIVVAAPVVPVIITTEPIVLSFDFTIDADVTVKFFDLPIESGGDFTIDGDAVLGGRIGVGRSSQAATRATQSGSINPVYSGTAIGTQSSKRATQNNRLDVTYSGTAIGAQSSKIASESGNATVTYSGTGIGTQIAKSSTESGRALVPTGIIIWRDISQDEWFGLTEDQWRGIS